MYIQNAHVIYRKFEKTAFYRHRAADTFDIVSTMPIANNIIHQNIVTRYLQRPIHCCVYTPTPTTAFRLAYTHRCTGAQLCRNPHTMVPEMRVLIPEFADEEFDVLRKLITIDEPTAEGSAEQSTLSMPGQCMDKRTSCHPTTGKNTNSQ